MDADDNESPATIFVHDLMWVANSPSLLTVSGEDDFDGCSQ
jgi:hypothetical protein